MIKIISDRIITDGGLVSGAVYIDGDRIVGVESGAQADTVCDGLFDFTGLYVSPGFIDMHTHGGGGYAFADSYADSVIGGVNFHARHGTTSILPTVSAGKFGAMKKSVAAIDGAMKSGRATAHILGAHLEGPYLSAAQCGAQCPTFITPPVEREYRSLIDEYPRAIRRWTYAPENDAKGEFCRYVTARGILASAGHSDATYADMRVALDNGCSLVTHLYSCTSTVTRKNGYRSLGIIESAFLLDELSVEIIADGKHLPPELINMIVKIKGDGGVALVTDSLEIAGTDVKSGVMSGTAFIVEDGVCKLPDRSAFAGSVATADVLVRTLAFDCGVDIVRAVRMLTKTPADILRVNKGSLEAGRDADIVVFDGDINVKHVFVSGKKIAP